MGSLLSPEAQGAQCYDSTARICHHTKSHWASLEAQIVKNPPTMQKTRVDLWVCKLSWRTACQPIPVFLHEEFHEQKSLVGYRSWGRKELDMTE